MADRSDTIQYTYGLQEAFICLPLLLQNEQSEIMTRSHQDYLHVLILRDGNELVLIYL